MNDLKKKLVLDVAYNLGDIVFLRTRDERSPGMVTRFSVTRNGVTYGICWGKTGTETWHFDYELTSEFLPSFET